MIRVRLAHAATLIGLLVVLTGGFLIARADTDSDALGVAYHNGCDWNGATWYDTAGGLGGAYAASTTNTSSWNACPYAIITKLFVWNGSAYQNFGSVTWDDPAPLLGEVAYAEYTVSDNRVYSYHQIKHPSTSQSSTRCLSFNVGAC